MRTRTKAYICGGIFLIMLVAGGMSDSIIGQNRSEYIRGQNIQGEYGDLDDDFAPREYIKIRPKQTKEELPE